MHHCCKKMHHCRSDYLLHPSCESEIIFVHYQQRAISYNTKAHSVLYKPDLWYKESTEMEMKHRHYLVLRIWRELVSGRGKYLSLCLNSSLQISHAIHYTCISYPRHSSVCVHVSPYVCTRLCVSLCGTVLWGKAVAAWRLTAGMGQIWSLQSTMATPWPPRYSLRMSSPQWSNMPSRWQHV